MISDDEVDEDDGKFRLDRRRHNNIKDWAVIATLVLNLGGLVWTAAKMSSAIEQLQVSNINNTQVLNSVVDRLYKLDTRTSVMEYQINGAKKP